MPLSYDFDEELRMSQGESSNGRIEEILVNHIPGALRAFQAHQENDRNHGVDWWVELESGRFMGVDCKVRKEDYAPKYDDIALETWSVVEKRIPGWTRVSSKKTEYILWLWMDTGRWTLIPFPMLCHVFSSYWQSWRGQYKTAVQETTRNGATQYRSECVFVPRTVIWSSIAATYAGKPSA
jgi:hypothetical protein